MAPNLSGQVVAFFLFDVAEWVDLSAVRGLLGASTESPRLAVRPAVPAYVRYQDPPVLVDAEAFGVPAPEGLQARFKIYDYGVFSLSLTRAVQRVVGRPARAVAVDQRARRSRPTPSACCRQAAERLGPRSRIRADATCPRTTSSTR